MLKCPICEQPVEIKHYPPDSYSGSAILEDYDYCYCPRCNEEFNLEDCIEEG